MGGERQRLLADAVENTGKVASAPSTSAANPTPQMDAPQSSGPPPFLTKTYEMVDDPSTHAIVSWSSANSSFVVWNPPEFAQELLPKYFKHNNFSSFVRQLNTYGFRKVDPDRWEFANEGFLRGRRDLLRTIHRRKPAAHSQQQQHGGEVGKFGLEGEIERLNRERNSMMLEMVRMRQQHQITERELQVTKEHLLSAELRQQSMISFFAKAMLNPSFLAQFVSQQKEDIHVVRKKRRFPVHEDEGDMDDSISPESSIDNQMVTFQRSGLGEAGARALLYQIFFPSDSPPDINSNQFDSPMREIDLPRNNGGANGFNQQSRVTVEEITTKFPDILSSVPIVTDVSTIEVQEYPLPSQPFDRTRVSGVTGSEDGSRYPHSEHRDSNESVEADGNRGTVSHEAEVQSARTDTFHPDTSSRPGTSSRPDTSAHNSGFWEQFLTEDPNPLTNTATRPEREVQLETRDLFQDDKKAVQSCSASPTMDVLSHQLGQLAPG